MRITRKKFIIGLAIGGVAWFVYHQYKTNKVNSTDDKGAAGSGTPLNLVFWSTQGAKV